MGTDGVYCVAAYGVANARGVTDRNGKDGMCLSTGFDGGLARWCRSSLGHGLRLEIGLILGSFAGLGRWGVRLRGGRLQISIAA